MKVRAAAIIAYLAIAALAFGGETVCLKVVYTQGCDSGSCTRYTDYGSAVVVSEGKPGEWRAITANHCLQNATVENAYVALDGEWVPVFNIYRVPNAGDNAFIAFRANRDVKTSATVEDDGDVQPGDEIVYSGFAEGKTFTQSSGKVIKTGLAQVQYTPRHGQSGGGVYKNGTLIGVVRGYDQDTGNLVYEPVGQFRKKCVQCWGFWIATCRPARPRERQVAIMPNTTPPPPTERPTPTVPTEKPPPSAPAPGVTKEDLKALTDAVIAMQKDLDTIKTDVASVKNTQIPVQVLAADGSIYSTETVKLGDPIKLRLVPKVK